MIMILEGQRGSGKTTIVKEIVAKLVTQGVDAEAWKAQRTDADSPFEGMMASIREFDQNPFKVFVLDRFHLTEYVMSTYLQRVPLQELLTATKILDSHLSSRHAKCVILDASYDTIDSRMALRDEKRKLDMPVLIAKNLWEEAQAISRIAITRNNNTPVDGEENVRFCVSLITLELKEFKREN